MTVTRAWRLLAWAAAYVVTAAAGRQLVMPETGLALVWPAAGIGALWLACCRGRTERVLAAGVLTGTLYYLVVVDTGLPEAAWWSAAQLGQTTVAAILLRRRPGLGLAGLRHPRQLAPVAPKEVFGIGAVSFAAATLGAVVGSLGVLDAGSPWSWWIPLSWTIRNGTGIFVVVALVATVSAVRRQVADGDFTGLGSLGQSRSVPELGVGCLVAALATAAVFGTDRHVPLAFLVIPSSVWFGLRFVPGVALGAALTQGVAVVGLTLAGRGPFAAEPDLALRATTVQLFLLLCCTLALLLSISVVERQELLQRVVRSDAEARERAELVSAVTGAMHEGLLVVDRDGHVVMSNPAAHVMLGDRAVTRLHLDLASDADGSHGLDGRVLTADERPTLRALRGEVVEQLDLRRTDPTSGATSVLSVSAVPLDRSGGDRVAVLVLSDVTEARASLGELKAFAGVVAHDLKGPVTGLRGWGEVLEEQLDAVDRDDAVDAARATLLRMQTTAERVQQLIDDLLAYAVAGSSDLHLERTTLRSVWAQAREQLPSYPHDGCELTYSGRDDDIEVDVVLVRQLLANLLGNAVKYVATGTTPRVQVRAHVEGDRLRVEVVDNGVGIPPEDQARVFEGFVRSSRTADYPGTGLGLAICARAVQRHGGTIGARDAGPDGGTVISFSLPRPAAAAAVPASAHGSPPSSLPDEPAPHLLDVPDRRPTTEPAPTG